MIKPKLLFLVTEDWFFRSHFMFLVERAIREGYECVVVARNTGAVPNLEGVRLVDLPFRRRSFAPWALIKQALQVRAIIRRERPRIVHAIALKSIVLLVMARMRGVAQILALTGRGYIALGSAPWTRLIRWRLRRLIRRALSQPQTLLLVENMSDADWVAHDERLGAGKVVLMPGAGVDLNKFKVAPEPTNDPLVVGVVARLVRSKGVGVAVEAVRRLRAEGISIVLRVAGRPDDQNPESISAAQLHCWSTLDGIEFIGHVQDVNAFWSLSHIACLPSLGGEGLPRSLIEAAACGRPIVTTRTPGCADFVGENEIGLLVKPGDAVELATALRMLAMNVGIRRRMGALGRLRVVSGYSVLHAGDAAARAWATVSEA
ncbi:glycosyltransferase [Vitreimonas flagellata]|uniref:glycosyltransferase n=1 Tax=Vitreimonas flagellata TaxID=2560861 RepID=UPI0014308BA7|nr:glycosyltransferase [Vitreimonas flagellata]